jgi:hypothetical protein
MNKILRWGIRMNQANNLGKKPIRTMIAKDAIHVILRIRPKITFKSLVSSFGIFAEDRRTNSRRLLRTKVQAAIQEMTPA